MVPFSDVPEVQGFVGKFVYNFFVPDEMNNDEGTPRFHGALDFFNNAGQKSVVDTFGHQVSTTTINAETPRFIELDWQPAALGGVKNFFDASLGESGFIKKHKQNLNDEASMNSNIDATQRKSSLNLRQKLVKKINLISKIKSPNSSGELTVPEIVEQFNDILDIDSGVVENLISKLGFADAGYVNERRVVDRTSQFLRAEEYNVFSNIDRRVGAMVFNPLFRLNTQLIVQYDDFRNDSDQNFALLKNESQKNHYELGIKVLPGKEELPLNSMPEFEAAPIGYVIERSTPDEITGLFKKDKTYYVDGVGNTKFLDTKIVYSKTYRYVITAVYAVKFVTPIADDTNYGSSVAGYYRMLALVKSKKSKSVILKTEELVHPQSRMA